MAREIAVLMAAGMGTRMRPLTEHVPKPLVKVGDTPIIETVIRGLLRRNIDTIYVVTGYLADCFGEIDEKYQQVKLVHNCDYATMNNISSLHAVSDLLGESDCFICEADVFVSDPTILDAELSHSCYYAKRVPGWSDDWVFDVDDEGLITRVGKGGMDAFNMVGIAYLKAEDAAGLATAIAAAYAESGNEQLFWDEVVDRHLNELRVGIHEVEPWQLHEIDTVDELAVLDPDWALHNGVKGECDYES